MFPWRSSVGSPRMLDELEEHGLPHTSLLLLSLRPLVVPEAGENGKRKREEGRGARGGGRGEGG